jgi:serine/threonine-protein kinase PRP4
VDVWSSAVTLFELYTGKFMFPGTSNNQLLMLHMRLRGKMPSKMIKKGEFGSEHFNI